MNKFTKRASEVLISCATAGFITQATIAPGFAENRMSDIPRGNFARQIPTPQCDGFEDYMRDAANHVVKGVEYLGERTIKTAVGLGKTLAGDPHALIDEVNRSFDDLGTAAATLSKYTPLALISVIVDQLPDGSFTNFLKAGANMEEQLRASVAKSLASGLNPLSTVNSIYNDGTEIFGDIGKILVNLDDPLAAGNEFLKLNQKWTGAGALTYMLTEKDPLTGMKKALNAIHRQVALVTTHTKLGPSSDIGGAILGYAMNESKKLIDKIPDAKNKQVASLLAATFATTFKETLKDPNFQKNGYNVSRHPFYFADIRKITAEWMGNDHNSGGKIDWGMDRAKVEDHHGCISLGDYAYNNGTVKKTTAVCGVENGRNKWWSRPIDYKLVWGDNCSGGTHDRSVWQPVCKPGYISVGFVAGRGSWKKPKPNRIACVKNDPHLFNVVDGLKANLVFTANDKGSGAKFDITTYSRNLDGLWLTHAVPVARDKGDKRFVQSLRVAVRVPGIAPSGDKSQCVNFYADQDFHGRTTQLCASRPVVKQIDSLGGPWGATHKNISSIQCGRGVAGMILYRHKLDGNPKLVPCHDYELNPRKKGAYNQYTLVQLLTRYVDPRNSEIEHASPEENERRADLKASCDKFNNESCLKLAQTSVGTVGWEKTDGALTTVELYGRACKANLDSACQWYQRYANQLCKAVGTHEACVPSYDAASITKLAVKREGLEKKRAACRANGLQSCFDFGLDLFNVGSPKSAEWSEAFVVFQQMCDGGFDNACQQLKALAANMCIGEMGKGCTVTGDFRIKDAPKGYEAPNRKAAIRDYEKGCNFGDEIGCQQFARLRIQDAYADPVSSKNRLAALQGPNPATPAGTRSKTPTNNRAKPSAVQTLADSCQRGSQRSCDLYEGYLGEFNSEKNGDYFKCVSLGEPTACTSYAKAVEGAELGTITKDPVTTKENKSAFYYEIACYGRQTPGAAATDAKVGDGEACIIIGDKSLSGQGGYSAGLSSEQREIEAINWYIRGCDVGGAASCLKAASIHGSPTYARAHPDEAARYERAACGLGSQQGCELLATRANAQNTIGQTPGDTRSTRATCTLQTTRVGFDDTISGSGEQTDVEFIKLKAKFSNSGPNQLTLNFRYNLNGESEWAKIQPGETIEIEDNKNRTYILLDVNRQCVGAVKLTSNDQHYIYSATGEVVHQITKGAPVGLTANTKGQGTQQQTGTPAGNQAPPATTTTASQVALLSPQSCSARGTAVSNANGVETKITFDNKSAQDLFVFWVGFDGQETNYEQVNAPLIQVAPGGIQTFDAMTGFQFSVFDRQGNCVGIANLTGENQTFAASGSNSSQNTASGNGSNVGNTQTTATAGNNQSTGQNTANINTPADTEDENKLLEFAGDGVTHGCGIRGQVVSQNGGEPTKTGFANFGADNLFLFWIDFNGQETDYAGVAQPLLMVAPGQVQRFDAQTGFAFSVFDQNSNCVGATTIAKLGEEFGIAGQGGPVEASIKMVMAAEQGNVANTNDIQPTNQPQNQVTNQDNEQINSQNGGQGNNLEADQPIVQTAGSCDLRGDVVSTSTGEIASTTIFNSGSGELSVFWIDYNGQETDYSGAASPLITVAPGTSENIDANIGFAYSIFDQTGTCLGVAEISLAATEFSFAGNHFASDDNNVVDENPFDQNMDDTSDNGGFQNDVNQQMADTNTDQGEFEEETQSDLFGQNGEGGFAGGCELRGQLVSTSTGEAASAVLSNNSAVEIDVFWIDFEGQETDYDGVATAMGSLEPGESETIDASVGFKFIGIDRDGNCLGIADVTQSEIQTAFQ